MHFSMHIHFLYMPIISYSRIIHNFVNGHTHMDTQFYEVINKYN